MKGRFMKTVLVSMFLFLFLFTIACLFVTYKTGYEPSTLVASVFAFCGIEGGLSAWIKTTKEKRKDEDYEN